jgi:hypothetical protein
MGKKRRNSRIVVPVNPLMTATSGMSGGNGGDPMPSAIHGQVVEEQVEDEKESDIPKSTGIRWIRLR